MQSIDLAGVGMTSQRTRERLIQRLADQGITNQSVLETIRITPRHIFLDEALSHRAYEDTALPIGFSQTLSQPYVVALMTQLLLVNGIPKKVLEIGTGSGYQAVILAQLVDQVFTVERIRPLLDLAKTRFRTLGMAGVVAKYSDGNFGLEEHAPYDGIIATAASKIIPVELLNQLAANGSLVIPVGDGAHQDLRVLRRQGDTEEFKEEIIAKVKFVPLLGGLAR